MCVVKTPKIERPADEAPPEPTVIRNPFLDGIDPQTRALRRGRSSLRIERGGGVRPSPTAPPIMSPAPRYTPPGLPRIIRGGGGGGGGRIEPVNRSIDLV